MTKVLIFIQLIIIVWLAYLNGYSVQHKDKLNESLTVRNEELVVNGNKLQVENAELTVTNDELNKQFKEVQNKVIALEEVISEQKNKELVEKDKLSLIDLKLENLTNRDCEIVYREKKVVEAKYDLLLKKTMNLIKEKKVKKEDFR